MNFIFSQIDRKINFLKFENHTSELKTYYQAKLELKLIFILGYLWNENFSKIDANNKEQIITAILKPSIGSIIQIIRTLDISNEFFGNKAIKKLNQKINEYPAFRNEKIGHGYSFEDDIENTINFYEDFFNIFNNKDVNKIFNTVKLIKVTQLDSDNYKGIIYESDGANYRGWSCPKQIQAFTVGDVYIQTEGATYLRLSPFILIENEDEFYSFCSIDEKLTGRTKYNRINKTGQKIVDVDEFEKLIISQDNFKIKSANGTVINVFDKNYKKYIELGITNRVITFLEKSRAFVFATIWGHGGVGKTASIQRVCETLCNQEKKIFDYIIFLSAKDRYYNYYQGKIYNISDKITSLEDIITKINLILFDENIYDEDKIINFSGKLFIIIDDFETFSKTEKSKIIHFIKRLDINHHKVVLTTRAVNLITGEEIQTKELGKEETIKFYIESIKNEFPSSNISHLLDELKDPKLQEKVFDITFGRPLFILQLGILTMQLGSLNEATKTNINTTKEAINFLYDRIYEYLSLDAKNMFLAISLITEENDLTGLITNLKFILNKEDKEDEFQASLNELIKLKIISIDDKDFFKVYSLEVYNLMKLYYANKGSEYDGNITNRYNLINTDDNSSTEEALLASADASRMVENESEVENRYRYILNRDKSPFQIKRTALLNYVKYLVTIRGKHYKAIKLFDDYNHLFSKDFDYTINFAPTCWAEGNNENKIKAIQILLNFLSLGPKKLGFEKYLEVLGMLMTYKAILVVNDRDELKTLLRTGEINDTEYRDFYKKQKNELKDILRYPGTKLWWLIKNIDIMTLSPMCRNQVLDGLTHLVEICIRNNKLDFGKDICHKILNEMPYNYHNPFIYKMQKIESILNKDKLNITSNLTKTNNVVSKEQNKPITEFGELLLQKLKK